MSLTSILTSVAKRLHSAAGLVRARSQSSPVRRRDSRRFRPEVEPLESRELLATAIGMNVEHVNDYMAAWMFTDAFKESRPWQRATVDTVTGNSTPDTSAPIDPHTGWPTLLRQYTDPTTGHQMMQSVSTYMFGFATGNHYPAGTYTAWWQGDGTVTWGGDVNQASIQLSTTTGSDGRQYHVAQFTVTPGSSGAGIQMTVTPSSANDANPIHDAHVWMPDYNGQHFAGQIWHPGANFSPFHPLFLQRLAPFHNLRFMDVQETVTSNVQHWTDVRPWNAATQQTGSPADGYTIQNGIAPEYIVELANELHADAWINVPHMAQDDYVSGLANLVHSTLNPSQHVYLEWSNEVWNFAGGFLPYQWITSQLPANATQQDRINFVAHHETHVFDLWSQVFSDHPGQLVRVVAGQQGNDSYNGPLLAAMNALGAHFDAFSVAAYFGPLPDFNGSNTTVDQVVAATQAGIPMYLDTVRRGRVLADQYSAQLGRHIAFVAYEGGPDLAAQQFLPPNDLTLAQDIRTINQAAIDPRMYGIYSNFLSQLSATGLELLDNYEYTEPANLDSPYGLYGALSYQDQPVAAAPAYHALVDYVGANPPPPTTVSPNQIYVGAVYRDVLGRSADPSGLASWTAALNAGLSRMAFANAVTHSAEYYTDFVTAAYHRYLGRSPEPAGLAYWLAAMQSGLTDERLEAGFLSSAEYIANHGGAGAGWVRGMYQDLLGRTPAQSEVDGWVQTLADGMAASQVAYGFAASPERETDRVTGDYQTFLGRTPDAAGLASWVNGFLSGGLRNEAVVAGFVASDEYFSKHS